MLHVGCGGEGLPPWLTPASETRLDIDPEQKPDIVASMTDMGEIGQFDVIYCSHALEHLHPNDILKALKEFRRCLKPDGYAVVMVPDCEDVKPTFEILYTTKGGLEVSGYDVFYGHSRFTSEQPHMRHQMAFDCATLKAAIEAAGFERYAVQRMSGYNLMGVMVA